MIPARRHRSSTTSNSSTSSSLSSSSSSTSSSLSSSLSPSSPSLSSSSLSDSGVKRCRKKKKKAAKKKKRQSRKRRKEDRILKQIKIDAPSAYSGKPDLDVFDKWALEVRNWVKLNRLLEWIAITMLNKYVSSKASVFYMKYVVGKEKCWTLTTIFEGLFEYCFPKDFKSVLRRRLMLAT